MWGACIDPGNWRESELYDIYFQVLRATPQGPEGCYDLVGYNFIAWGMGGEGELDHCIVLEDIPPEDQIQVEPGDVVGFRIEHFRNGDRDNGGPQLVTDRTDVTVWYLMGQDMATGPQTTCRFCVGPGPELGRLVSSTDHPPVITAHVCKFNSRLCHYIVIKYSDQNWFLTARQTQRARLVIYRFLCLSVCAFVTVWGGLGNSQWQTAGMVWVSWFVSFLSAK